MPQSEDLVSEISQIMEQYRREVPGKRSRIPLSVKERVLGLQGLGLTCAEISRRTGIPYFSVLRWKNRRRGGFEVMRVTNGKTGRLISKADTVTVARRRKKRVVATVTVSTAWPTVSIVTPSGIRIEGVSLDTLLKLVPELGGGR